VWCRYLATTCLTSSSNFFSLIRCTSCCLPSKVRFSKQWCSYWCISHTWVYGFHTETDMDRSATLCSYSWTSCLPFVCCAQDFLNLLHILEILYFFFITFQDFPRDYNSLLIVHLILLGYSTTHSYSCFHYLLDLVFLHHHWVQGLLLLSSIHFFLHFHRLFSVLPPFPHAHREV
jgi:hypothetical protein